MSWAASGFVNTINTTLDTADIMAVPELDFEADEDSLYTVMILDYGMVDQLGGMQYFHWMLTNLPGTFAPEAFEAMEYIAPFGFERNATNTGVVETGDAALHDVVTLVYKQPGVIDVEETQSGCNPEILGARIHDQAVLAEKYGLEGPVAGTFSWTKLCDITPFFFCNWTLCTGAPWPFPIPGVNDL